jgi:hypothetical protein
MDFGKQQDKNCDQYSLPSSKHTNLYCGAFGSSTKINLSMLTVLGMNGGRGNSCRSNLAGSSLFTRLKSNQMWPSQIMTAPLSS